MPDSLFPVMALAGVVLLLTGMVMVFARRAPWLAPFRDQRIAELIGEVKALRSRINALADAQDQILRHLESAEARRSNEQGNKP